MLFCGGNGVAAVQANEFDREYQSAWMGEGNTEPKIKFRAQISFGDSLSDVGSYAVGTVVDLAGGQFTVNGPKAKNWTAVMAERFGLPAPCAARVTEPVGVGNKWTGNEHVLHVDAYSDSLNQSANPSQYGLSNVADTACDMSPAKNPLGSSLVCSAANLMPGDASHYLFADRVHPAAIR